MLQPLHVSHATHATHTTHAAHVTHGTHGTHGTHITRAPHATQEVRTQLEDRISAAHQQMETLESHLESRAERHEVEAALRNKLSIRQFEEEMRAYAKTDDLSTHLKQRAQVWPTPPPATPPPATQPLPACLG